MPSIFTGILSSAPLYTVSVTAASLYFLRSRLLSSPPSPLPSIRGSPLLTAFAIDAGIQAAFYVHALLSGKTEKYYDLSGSLTYLSVFGYTLLSRGGYDARRGFATIAGCLWASRLGGYLYERIVREGKDERFDKLKSSAARFAIPWAMQAVWVGLVGAPVLLINTLPAAGRLVLTDYVGRALWVGGFLIEAISDRQKDVAKREKPKDFVQTGLWSISRHPNYLGEIMLQTGLFVASISSLSKPWHFALSAASPLFSWFLLTRVSGIPMLEPEAKKKYGAAWAAYCEKVPELWPWSKAGPYKAS
ncbi:hypothetical protein DFJ74DRAFT_689709 [Hyaloraphidium curvatum]|nr:hypothetical protein DFJ74DRAFT_689709 [Hyaloraphidium curvatum]